MVAPYVPEPPERVGEPESHHRIAPVACPFERTPEIVKLRRDAPRPCDLLPIPRELRCHFLRELQKVGRVALPEHLHLAAPGQLLPRILCSVSYIPNRGAPSDPPSGRSKLL